MMTASLCKLHRTVVSSHRRNSPNCAQSNSALTTLHSDSQIALTETTASVRFNRNGSLLTCFQIEAIKIQEVTVLLACKMVL